MSFKVVQYFEGKLVKLDSRATCNVEALGCGILLYICIRYV